MDLNTLYHRTVETWVDRVNAVPSGAWGEPTPCREWDVRSLVNHVTGEDLWTDPLMRGATIAEVGDRFDGDLLGDDPVGRSLAAAGKAVRTVAETLPAHGTVHLSYGEESMDEYIHQLAADHLVHGWDLAVATGSDPRLDPHLVKEVATWFADKEQLYRQGGVIAARTALTGEPQGDLLARFGRDPHWGPTHAALTRFNTAFGAADLEATMDLVTDDCVFDATGPAPDGREYQGVEAVRGAWAEVFASTRDLRFTEEDSFVHGDRATVMWRFDWTNEDGSPGHVRGVDVMRIRDGRVSEKFSYVKG
ncbi:MAG TPA: TIGR03086 family metal-binding protein, partial [Intrasporangium sp.]|nr:TIGR03086 family metal-binding protein [Intrasporangium sp.]